MRLPVPTKVAVVLGASILISAALSAFASYLGHLERRQTEVIADHYDVALAANALVEDVQKAVAQVMAIMVADDAQAARKKSVALQDDLQDVARRRTDLLAKIGDRMPAAEKSRLSLRIDEFIAYQADTAKLCLELSPRAAIIQANDEATVLNRQRMVSDVRRLSQRMLASVEVARKDAEVGQKIRLGMLQVVPASVVIVGGLVAVASMRRRDAKLQKRRYDVALNNMPLGVCMVDENGLLTVVSDRLATLFGIGSELNGLTVRQLAEEIALATNLAGAERDAFVTRFGRFYHSAMAEPFIAALGERLFEIRFHKMEDGGHLIVIDDVTAARAASQKIERMAMYDCLTGLSNRVRYREQLALTVRECSHYGWSFAILCIDLDAFKEVNDTLGHPMGDKLLCEVADRLTAAVEDDGLVARLGGDEFVVMLAPTRERYDLDPICARLIAAISAPYAIEGHTIAIGASIGAATFPRDALTAESLVKCADLALYRAKGLGRSCYRHFDASMQAEANLRRQIETDLRTAVANGELELFYQPIVDVRTRRANTFEALLRWRHPRRGLISPSVFIPVAEESGLIVEIGAWALDRACRDAAAWPDDMRVAVNVSPVQFRRSDVVALVAQALAVSGLAPERLEVEVTEAILIRDAEATRLVFEHLRRMGVRLALDDFGSGYSSLGYLNKFPFNKIKIDRAFVDDLKNAKSLAVIMAVVQLAERLNLSLVVEGVETEEQLAILRERGIHNVQGFLFSPPRPLAEIAQMLREPVASQSCRAA